MLIYISSFVFKGFFSFLGPLIERIVAICQTKEDQQKWVDLIREQSKNLGHKINTPLSRVKFLYLINKFQYYI